MIQILSGFAHLIYIIKVIVGNNGFNKFKNYYLFDTNKCYKTEIFTIPFYLYFSGTDLLIIRFILKFNQYSIRFQMQYFSYFMYMCVCTYFIFIFIIDGRSTLNDTCTLMYSSSSCKHLIIYYIGFGKTTHHNMYNVGW